MLSLQEKALSAALANAKTLREVIKFCSENGSARDLCSKSKAFWLAILPKLGEELIALAFEPLKEKYWPLLVEALADNLYRKYLYTITEEFMEMQDFEPLVFYEALDTINQEKSLYIPGIKLKSKTVGWVLEMKVDNVMRENIFLLASRNHNEDLLRLSKASALMVKVFVDSQTPLFGDEFFPDELFYALVDGEHLDGVKTQPLNGRMDLKRYYLETAEKIELPYGQKLKIEVLSDLFYTSMKENEESGEIIYLNNVGFYNNSRKVNVFDPFDESDRANPSMKLFYSTQTALDLDAYKVSLY